MDISMTKFRNQEVLNEALNIYKVSMCQFIYEHLQRRVRGETVEDLIRRIVNREPFDLEPKHISQIFLRQECWNFFKRRFGYDPRLDSDKYDIRSAASMILMGRNKVHHVGSTDLDPEFTRTHLFFITDVLGEINKPDAKCEVEEIRDRLFSDEEHVSDISEQLEAMKAEYTDLEKQLKIKSDLLENVEKEKTVYDKDLKTTSDLLEAVESDNAELEERLEATEAEKHALEEQLKTASTRLKDVERENAAYKERREVIPDQLETANAKKVKYEKAFKAASNQLATLKTVNTQLEERLETTSAQLEEVEEELVTCEERLSVKPYDYSERSEQSPKYQRKWRRPGAVAALRDPTEIRAAEAQIAKILNPSEKSRLERELQEAKQAVYGSTT